jgi:hypothetical protein
VSRKSARRPEKTNAQRRFDASKPIEPIVIDSTDVEEVEDVHLFTLDDVPYFMPGQIGANLALKVLERIELDGEEAGISFMLYTVLGEEAHTALKTCDSLKASQLTAITDVVLDRVLGAMDAGN